MPRAGPACTQTVWAPHPRHVWLCFPQTCNAGCPISTALKTRLRAVSQSSLGCLEPMTEIRPPQRESLKCLGACSEGRSSDVTAHQVGLKSAFPPGPLGPEQVLFSSAVTASAGPSPPPPAPHFHRHTHRSGRCRGTWSGLGASEEQTQQGAQWPAWSGRGGQLSSVHPCSSGRLVLSPQTPSHGERQGGWQPRPPPRWRQRVLSCPPCTQGPPSEQGGGGGGGGGEAQGAELEALNLPENIRDAVTRDWAEEGEV